MKACCGGAAAGLLCLAFLTLGDAYLFRNPNYNSVEREEALAQAAAKAAASKNQEQSCPSAPAPRPRATFKATRVGTITLPAAADLDAYLASEVARPKLLYADCYEKLDVNKFRCEIEPIKFFSAYIIPILDMSLWLDKKEPSALVEAVSQGVRTASNSEQLATKGMGFSHGGKVNEDSFQMTTRTRVTWSAVDNSTYSLTSEQSMQISMEKPAWLMVPSSMFNSAGDMILGQVLKGAVPEYLAGLQAGFKAWSEAVAAKAL